MIKEGIHIKGIYKHYKVGDLYKITEVSYRETDEVPVVNYHACNEHGVYKSLRHLDENMNETIVKQPFNRPVSEFLEELCNIDIWKPRFILIKSNE